MLAKINEVFRGDIDALQDVGQMVRDVAFFVSDPSFFLGSKFTQKAPVPYYSHITNQVVSTD